jgi:Bacterial proteasome assembling chaperone-like protein
VAVAISRASLKDPAESTSSVSVIAIPGHKEDQIARQVARKLSKALRTTVVISSYLRWLYKHKPLRSVRKMTIVSAGTFLIMFMLFQGNLAGRYLAGQIVWFGSVGLLGAIVVATLPASVVLTMRDFGSGRRKLLRLTNVGRKALIHGYVFDVLYHLRFLLLLVIGVSPIAVLGWAHYLAAGEWFQRCTRGLNTCYLTDIHFAPDQLPLLLLISVILVLAMISTILTNTLIGIWMTLRWHDLELALGSAFVLGMVGSTPTIFFFILYMAASLYIALGHDRWLAIPVLLVAAVLGVTPLPLIGLSSLGAAEKWAWYQLENDRHG